MKSCFLLKIVRKNTPYNDDFNEKTYSYMSFVVLEGYFLSKILNKL